MYGKLLPLLLCVGCSSAAPSDNSDITYVKIQPITSKEGAVPRAAYRESRIENLPLTIKSYSIQNDEEHDNRPHDKEATPTYDRGAHLHIRTDKGGSHLANFRNGVKLNDNVNTLKLHADETQLNRDETPRSIERSDNDFKSIEYALEKDDSSPQLSLEKSSQTAEDEIEDVEENVRHVRSDYTTSLPDETETTDDASSEQKTESAKAPEVTVPYVQFKALPKSYSNTYSAPRFYSKLSYYNKENELDNHVYNVLPYNKKKYKSRCRCEKIWNCPRIQISVPRCPNEQFMCCF